MFYRIYPTKDCYVTNYRVGNVPATHSNTGASEILQLFKLAEPPQSGSKSHILLGFNTSSFPAVTGTKKYVLRMVDARHAETLPYGYDVWIRPLEQNWDEGRGHDLDAYSDRGTANWVNASVGTPWAVPGAYPSGALSATFHFDTGEENLEADVTNIIPSASQGLFVQLPTSLENDEQDYFVKMFYGRKTHFPENKPCIEMQWEDWSVNTGSALVDPPDTLKFTVYNLREVYDPVEDVTLRVHVQTKDWNPAVVATASSDVSGVVLTNAYYRIINDSTDEVVVPFGTGSIKYTKLSCADGENYFRIHMGSLAEGEVFRLEFMYTVGSDTVFVPGYQNKFRVK
jgi:hypothetical protein